jgi:hypothetical protein
MNRLGTYGRVSLASIGTTLTQNGSAIQQAQTFGFTQQTFGINYSAALSKNFSITPQFQIDLPLSGTDASPGALSDGSVDMTGGGFFIYRPTFAAKQNLEISSGVGYTYRTHFFSAGIPWLLQLKYNDPETRLSLQLSLHGLASLKTDPHTYRSSFFRANHGTKRSLMTGAMNPSSVQAQGSIAYQLPDFSTISLSLTRSIGGQMSPLQTSLTLGYQFQISTEGKTQDRETRDPISHASPHAEDSARVLSVNDKLGLIKINHGSAEGIQIEDEFNFFSPLNLADSPVARGKVTHSRQNESVLKILTYFGEGWISEGAIAKKVNSFNKPLE